MTTTHDYRYDSRSQWQSSGVADLDRQQDPAAGPPGDAPDPGKSQADPMGAVQDPGTQPDATRPVAGEPVAAQPSSTTMTSGAVAAPAAADPSAVADDGAGPHQAATQAPVEPGSAAPSAPAARSESSANLGASVVEEAPGAGTPSNQASALVDHGVGAQNLVAMPTWSAAATTDPATLDVHADLTATATLNGLVQPNDSLLVDIGDAVDSLAGGAATLLDDALVDIEAVAGGTLAGVADLLGGAVENTQALLGGLEHDLGLGDPGVGDTSLHDLEFAGLDLADGLLADDEEEGDDAGLAGLAAALGATAATIFAPGDAHGAAALHDLTVDPGGALDVLADPGLAAGPLFGGIGHGLDALLDLSG
jgi:hypothetical protein